MEAEKLAEKLVKGFHNDRWKSAMYVIVKYCVDEVGEDKNRIVDMLKLMESDEELNKVVSSSFISKQLLKPFCSLSADDRAQLLNELSDAIINCSSENEGSKSTPTKKLYKTKNAEISFKLDSGYETRDNSVFDFYAIFDKNLEIVSKICQTTIFDTAQKEHAIEEFTRVGKLLIKRIDNEAVESSNIEEIKNKKIRVQENGLQRMIYQNTKSYTFESNRKVNKMSVAVVSGEGFADKIYVILMIQTCDTENYSKYESIINDNIHSCIEHKLDTTEKRIELEHKNLGKIVLSVDEVRGEAVVKEADFDMSIFDEADFIFAYGEDDIESLEEFLSYKEKYLEALNNIFKFKDKIKSALYEEAKSIYDNWLDEWYTPEEITEEFVRKYTQILSVHINKDAVFLSADYIDASDEDRDLGGHGFDLFLDEEDFENNCDNISWSLNG